jgi:chemotaxis protein methyltransferase CheR
MRKMDTTDRAGKKETSSIAAVTPYPRALAHVSGLDLTSYRPEHVAERIRRALGREDVPSVEALVRLLGIDPAARLRFRRSIAVPVSGLFRDAHQFERLDRDILPELVAREGSIHVWSAGCADGSELYSVALLLERHGALERARLLGSDLLEENLEVAARGEYGDVAMRDTLRSRVRFEQRDIVREGAPPGAWHLVLCRNVAIYLERGARRRLHQAIAGALAPGGTLLLGRSERLDSPHELGLDPLGSHAYRRTAQ